MQSTLKISIPHLIFEKEVIEAPIGLSEMLEKTWTLEKDSTDEVVSEFTRSVYQNPDGRWVTKFERKSKNGNGKSG